MFVRKIEGLVSLGEELGMVRSLARGFRICWMRDLSPGFAGFTP